ncbi:DUF2993 domain-containing protein [Streptomyces gamaensis]|uniref:DUF2993 domain-containing protein n=1 Tax=Streptomyces gamaensis TaxID=1763542 RepID=A0ABW0Z281_9ACTN
MRTPTRIPVLPANPYDELASLDDEYEPCPPHPLDSALQRPAGEVEDEPWSPPDHRRAAPRRRRRRARRRPRHRHLPLKLLITAGTGAALLVLADRCAALYAEKEAEQKLQQTLHLEAAPQVDIRGFPFLTQLVDKELTEVDVTVPHLAADRVSIARVQAKAHGIRIRGDLPSDIRGAVVGRLNGSVLLAFDDMNRELSASQLKFGRESDDTIVARGDLTVAGRPVRIRARAHVHQDDGQSLSTRLDAVTIDLPGIAVYRPVQADGNHGKSLTLHREAAERIARDAARVKALFSVPALAARLGVTPDEVAIALREDERLHEIAGTPRFVESLTRINLVDVVAGHPWLLQKIGIDPAVVTGLSRLRPPTVTDGLTLSYTLPAEARKLGLRLDGVKVGDDGVQADVTADDLPVDATAH